MCELKLETRYGYFLFLKKQLEDKLEGTQQPEMMVERSQCIN